MMKTQKIIPVLCGPTASGKTHTSILWAKFLNAEIISADSGQIYRGLDIGTAKPSAAERQGIPFHLLDIVNPDEFFSAATFRKRTLVVIDEIFTRGREVLIVGGTGLYLKILEEGVFDGPQSDPEKRRMLERRFEEEGGLVLHQELMLVDPEAARDIPPQNRQRLIRALLVYQQTGIPLTEHWKKQKKGQGSFVYRKFAIDWPRSELYRRIDERVDVMMEQGLETEVRMLHKKWGATIPAFSLIGYREFLPYFRGEYSLDKTRELLKKNSRHYAKRQLTWFLRDPGIQWIPHMEVMKLTTIAMKHLPDQWRGQI